MDRSRLVLAGCLFVVLHLVLDWLGQRYADAAQSIISWNPAAGLGIVWVCHYGRRATALILPTTLLSSLLLRGPGEPTNLAAVEGLIVGTVYSIAALAITSARFGFESRLDTVKELIVLMLTAVVSSSIVAACYVLSLAFIGNIAVDALFGPLLRYWVGDLIGIIIVVPFGLLALDSRLALEPTKSSMLLFATTAVLIAVAIGYRDPGGFTYFYFLFFPVIWAALAQGIEGVVPVLALIQAGVYVTVTVLKLDFLDITHFQARVIALSATGLIAGVLVSERQRFEAHNRRQQQALAQVALRGGMGELSAAIAHEVNQPLSAAGTFAGLVVESLTTENLQDPTVIENARKIVRQIDRASEVVRRLRALVKLARDDQAPIAPSRMILEVVDLMRPEALRIGINLSFDIQPELPMLVVDRLQIEQALLNLVRNAIEAVQVAAGSGGIVTIYARQTAHGAVELGVEDDGPGFPSDFSLDRLQPFSTTKEDGLGIGLSLCQSIALANGGQLVIRKAAKGAHIAITFGKVQWVSQ